MRGRLLGGLHYQLDFGSFATVSYWSVCSYQSIFFHGTKTDEPIR